MIAFLVDKRFLTHLIFPLLLGLIRHKSALFLSANRMAMDLSTESSDLHHAWPGESWGCRQVECSYFCP